MGIAEDPAPPRGQAIVVWGVGTLFLGLGLLTAVMIGILAEQVRHRLHVADDAIGMLSAVFYLAYSAAQFVGGIVLDRRNPRWVLGVSSLIAAVGCFLLADASNMGAAVVGRVLLGIGLSTSFLGAIYLARIWFPPERFALMAGISQLATNVGLAVMLIGLSVTGAIPSLRAAMLSMAVGYLLLGIAIMLLVCRPATVGANPAGAGHADYSRATAAGGARNAVLVGHNVFRERLRGLAGLERSVGQCATTCVRHHREAAAGRNRRRSSKSDPEPRLSNGVQQGTKAD